MMPRNANAKMDILEYNTYTPNMLATKLAIPGAVIVQVIFGGPR